MREGRGGKASFREGVEFCSSTAMRRATRREQHDGGSPTTRENQSGILRGVTACFTILNHAMAASSSPIVRHTCTVDDEARVETQYKIQWAATRESIGERARKRWRERNGERDRAPQSDVLDLAN